MMKIQGVWTALVTPMNEDGSIDWSGYEKLLDRQKNAKISGVIPCGTTGESPTVSEEEKKKLITLAVETFKGTDTKVGAGTGSNHTAGSIESSKWASDCGVDLILVVAPYYNKPTQKGLIDHFTAIADSVSCGVMLYNIPGRSVVNMSIDTIVNLAKHRNILALKEATGSVSYLCEIFDAVKKNQTSLELLSGDDGNFLPSLSVGATGVVSVASNLIPKSMMALFEAAHSNDLDRARNIHQRLFPLFRDEFIESNPAPIKYALSKMGIGSPMVRLPLVPLSESHRPILDRLVKEMGDDHV